MQENGFKGNGRDETIKYTQIGPNVNARWKHGNGRQELAWKLHGREKWMLNVCTNTFYYVCKKTDSKEMDEIKQLNILKQSVCVGMLNVCTNTFYYVCISSHSKEIDEIKQLNILKQDCFGLIN